MWTEGVSCEDFCGRQGRDCLHAQNNIEASCALDPAHDRQDMSKNGCLQRWENQICGCSVVKDIPTTNRSVISTRVLGLEYSSPTGEALHIEHLETPFVLELAVDEGIFACGAVSNRLELCSGSCIPRGSCANRDHQYCSFFNVELDAWEVDNRSPPGYVSAGGRSITCEFDHLTDVASFLGPSPLKKFNEPCFSCLSDFLSNPAGIIVVLTGLVLLVCTAMGTLCKHYQYSHRLPDQIALSKFAQAQKRVTARDADVKTSLVEDVKHKLQHDWMCGGILCPLPSDPFDWCQRGLLLVTTLLVNLMTSLMFFQPEDDESACVKTCEQQTHSEEEVCTTVCNEPEKDGIWISLVTAVISIPATVAITKALRWLHTPVIAAVEPMTRKDKKPTLPKMVKTLRAASKARAWANKHKVAVSENNNSFRTGWRWKGGTEVSQTSTRLAGTHEMPRALEAVVQKQIAKTRADMSSGLDMDPHRARDIDQEADIQEVVIPPSDTARSKEEDVRPVMAIASTAFTVVPTAQQFRRNAKKKLAAGDLDAYVAACVAERNTLQKRQAQGVPPLPRKPSAACVPVLLSLICGLLSLFMIYGIAAKLGPVRSVCKSFCQDNYRKVAILRAELNPCTCRTTQKFG
eukprot:COSAG02_NODE_4149_length_5710_cov_6.668330_6_plen_632_part_00